MSKTSGSPSSGPDWRDIHAILLELAEDGHKSLIIRLVPYKSIIGEPSFKWEVRDRGGSRILSSQYFLDSSPTSSATASSGLYVALHRAWDKLEEES